MSKSSYKEAIEILVNMGNSQILEVVKALKQAQKQEKLLELYRELATVKDDMFDACDIVDADYYIIIRKTETNLYKQIGELEK